MNKSTTTKPMGASEDKRETIGEQAKGLVSNVASTVKEGVSNKLDVRKEKAVEKIDEVADAVRQTGQKIDAGPIPELAERAANGIDRVARFFESNEIKDVITNVEGFARREPALFLGGAVAVGLVLGRFLKSSTSTSSSSFSSNDEFRSLSDRYDDYGGYGYDEYLDDDDIEESWDVGPRNIGANASDFGASSQSSQTSQTPPPPTTTGIGGSMLESDRNAPRTTDPMGLTGLDKNTGSSFPKGRP